MGRRSSGGGYRSAPRARTPAPAKPAATPAPATQSNGGGLMGVGGSIVSGVVEGLTWGAGISLGHRIVDFFAGPRTIRVVETPRPSEAPAGADACSIHNQAFADCISHNGSDISRCQFYIDLLNQCRRQGSNAGITAAVSIV